MATNNTIKKTIIVFKKQDEKANRFFRNQPKTWAIYNAPRMSRINFLKEKGVDVSQLMNLSPGERAVKADELIKEVFTPNCEAAEATITVLQPIRNKTQQGLFANLTSFNDVGEELLNGAYNQSLRVMIESTPIEVTPFMLEWDDELPFQFVNQPLTNQVVVSHGITPGRYSCYSLAVGCELEDGLLKVGIGAKFYFKGAYGIKDVDFSYYFNFNKNRGKQITIPADMDVLKFNFHCYNWQEALANGDYAVTT